MSGRERRSLCFPLLAFLAPLIYRVIVEIYSNPYTVGYDVFVYYMPYLTGYSSPSAIELYGYSPLYFIIAGALQPLFGDPLLTAKAIAIALQALLGLSLYLWASTTLSRRMSLLFSLSSSFFFTTLRISWDLHRNVLGLVLMLLALYSLEKVKERRWRILTASALGILTALAQPFMPIIMIMMLLPKILRRDVEALCISLLAAVTLGSTLFTQFISKSSLYNVWLISDMPSGSFQLFPSGWIALQFLIYIIAPLFPILFLVLIERKHKDYQALKKGMPALIWLAFCIVLGLVTDIGFRFILLIPIPAIFLMMLYNGRKARALLIAITIFLAIGYTSYGTQSPFPYFSTPIMWNSNFLNAVPSSILQNTVPLEDSHTVDYLFKNLKENIQKDNSSIVLTFEPMLGYAVLSGIPMDRIISLGMMANQTQLIQYLSDGKDVYIVWWKIGYEWYGINMSNFLNGINYSILDSKGDYDIYFILPTL